MQFVRCKERAAAPVYTHGFMHVQANASPPDARQWGREHVWSSLRGLFPPLSRLELDVSFALYSLLAKGEPVTIRAAALTAGLPRADVEDVVSRLPCVFRDPSGRVTDYWGISSIETPHRVAFADNLAYAWSAWDALFICHALGVTAQVQSRCARSATPVILEIGPHGAEAAGDPPAVSFAAPAPFETAAQVAAKYVHDCHFFAAERWAGEWAARHPGTSILSLADAWELARRRNEACYGVDCKRAE